MELKHEDFTKVAKLAKLTINAEHKQAFEEELGKILSLVAKLDEVDTAHVQPLAHPVDAKQRLRSDQVTATNERTLYQQNAPQVTAGLYIVPQVIETDE